ncbi:MAG: type I-D CRISPR-associated protein Cas7/Csc2 [Thermoproteota archaeon]
MSADSSSFEKGLNLIASILNEKNINELKPYFANLDQPNQENAVPRGRVANIFLILVSEGELVIRHEGGEDISIARLMDNGYPIILHEKLVSAWRRETLEMLRHHYDTYKDNVNKIRGKNDEWHCYLRPFQGGGKRTEQKSDVEKQEKSKGKNEEYIGGLCGECPNCMIFGYAVKDGNYNVKSRIEGDLYFSTLPENKSVVVRTFNAVDETTHTTYIPTGGERTGALFRLSLIKAGTIFVGKVAIKDLSPAEFLLSLYSLVNTTRIGGVKSDFGKIKVIIPAITLCEHEVSSGYDIFTKVKDKNDTTEVVRAINSYLSENFKNCKVYTNTDFTPNINNVIKSSENEIIINAWRDSTNFKKSIEKFVNAKQSP